jgi:transposase
MSERGAVLTDGGGMSDSTARLATPTWVRPILDEFEGHGHFEEMDLCGRLGWALRENHAADPTEIRAAAAEFQAFGFQPADLGETSRWNTHLDRTPRRRVDPARVRRQLSPQLPPRMAHQARLLAATTDAQGPPARRRGHRRLGRQRLACHPKKASESGAHLVLIDETGLFLNPLVRRTWSVIGQTPVIDADGGRRDKVSVIGGVSVSARAQRMGFYFATEPGGFFTAEKVAGFLRDLLEHLRGNVVVVWDRGGNHKGPVIRELLRKNRRLRLELLPAWAPDHNPVEAVWSWLKYGALANFVPAVTTALDDAVIERLVELKFDPELLRALWERSELPFPERRHQ